MYTAQGDETVLAAIAEYEGGLSRARAEDLAAQCQGLADAAAYWAWLADYVIHKRIPR
ncbi:hypothetical protein [Celeribacter litoreus]|uniref:hypothetical protein n=1 Tax=Celeribacter litoreus TaxID=2876714 RepID=UPI001CC9C22E|nr:hypothetical protein [Celeribacter litoreus]